MQLKKKKRLSGGVMESASYNQRLATVSRGSASVTGVNLAAAVATWLIQLCNLVLPSTIFQLSLS